MKGSIYLKLFGFSLMTGATFHLARYVMQYFSAAGAAGWRFGLAAGSMLLLLISKEKLSGYTIRKNVGAYLFMGVTGIFGFNTLFFLGMEQTSPVNGALIMATNPLVTMLLARILLKEPVSTQQKVGGILAFIGVFLVITGGSWDAIRHLHFSAGDMLIMAGNICWALYGITGKGFVRDSTSLQTTAYTMTIGAVMLMFIASRTPAPVPISSIPLTAWAAIVFMALGMSVLGYIWWNEGAARIGIGRAALFFNLVPVVTLCISLVLGMAVTGVQIIGSALVIAGVLYASGMTQVASQRKTMQNIPKSDCKV